MLGTESLVKQSVWKKKKPLKIKDTENEPFCGWKPKPINQL